MLASVLVDEGPPQQALRVERVDVPDPAEGQVRVRVTRAGLNHLDLWIRTGMPRVPKPRITGADGTGVIDAVGPGSGRTLAARGLGAGDPVVLDPGSSCGTCPACASGETSLCRRFSVLGEHSDGTHAQYVVVPAASVHPRPAHLGDDEAGALMLTHATAWRMLFTRAAVRPHERVLVWGASSGVGAAAVQLCAAAGIETIATTREGSKAEAISALGATHVVVTGSEGDAAERVVAAVEHTTSGDGVDVAFDHLGAVAWLPSMRALRRGGRYVTCGATTGADPGAAITRLFWKQLSMLGSTMASASDVVALLRFVEAHRITPRVDSTWELADIASAHDRLEQGAQVGKVVLRIPG